MGQGINFSLVLEEIATHYPDIGTALSDHLMMVDINAKDKFGDTLLHVAVDRNWEELVRLLLQKGADQFETDEEGLNPFHRAVTRDKKSLVELFLAAGMPVATKTHLTERIAVHLAASRGFSELARRLLNVDPSSINEADTNGMTALHFAAVEGQAEVVGILFGFDGIQPNKVALGGNTALHLAVREGYADVVSLLAANPIDTTIRNTARHTALSLAKELAFAKITHFLEEYGAPDSSDAISISSQDKAEELVVQVSGIMNTEPRRAVELIKQILKLNPYEYRAYFMLANITWRFQNNAELAATQMKKSLEIEPRYVESYYWYARMLYDLRKPELYSPYFIRYAQLRPDSYNTKDLKQNWPHLLEPYVPSPEFVDVATDFSTVLTESKTFRYSLIVTVSLLLGLLILVQRRMREKPAGSAEVMGSV